MTDLHYRSRAHVDDLLVGECTIYRAGDSSGRRWWLLWFRAPRDTDGGEEDFAVPVNPNGSFLENGPGGKTWALNRGYSESGSGTWQITPSINVEDTRELHPNGQTSTSLWHHTPTISGVSDDEPWITLAP